MPDTSPALRFLSRGQQLLRLQAPVLEHVMAEVSADKEAVTRLPLQEAADVPALAKTAVARLANTAEKMADLGLLLQLFLARHVDNFQTFLDETLRAILLAQPGLLARTPPVPMKEVIAAPSREALLATLTERRVLGLAYKSLRDLQSAVREDMGFELFPDGASLGRVELVFDVRNLITHNAGIVNGLFLEKHPTPPLPLDAPYPLSLDKLKTFWETLIEASGDIERRAKRKFKLGGV